MNFSGHPMGHLTYRLAVVVLLLAADNSSAQQPHTLTGDIRFHRSFHSKTLNNDRDVVVYLPPGYESNEHKRYAVLYLQDGQNLFDGATSFIPGKEGGSTRPPRH